MGAPPGVAPPSSTRDRKRPAPPEPLDQLPYQRKVSFRRSFHVTLDEQIRAYLHRHGGSERVRMRLGRIVGRGTQKDIILPTSSLAILEGDDHVFDACMPQSAHEILHKGFASHHAAWQKAAPSARRWAHISLEEIADAPAPLPPPAKEEALLLYCPDSRVHLELLAYDAAFENVLHATRREVRFVVRKDSREGSLWWRVSLCTEGGSRHVELDLNLPLLWEHWRRMRAKKPHTFSILSMGLLRNGLALVDLLRGSGDASDTPMPFYPSILEPSAAVREHYAKKAAQNSQAPLSREASQNIRRYNNLIKVLLIERFVDTLKGPVRLLDLGCGNGQDVLKYSREFRGPDMQKYVGVDFAPAAVTEASRRYAQLTKQRGQKGEYSAEFFSGDLTAAGTFEKIKAAGHESFDVVTVQFTLQYLAESEPVMRQFLLEARQLLRPGGLLLGSVPSCEALSELCTVESGEASNDSASDRWSGGNSLFQVSFSKSDRRKMADFASEAEDLDWGIAYQFSLVAAVDGQREFVVPWDKLEELANSLGFHVVSDAAFPDVLDAYKDTSAYFTNIFSKADAGRGLTEDETALFGLYNAFVFQLQGGASEPA